VEPGHTLLLDDGKIRMTVIGKKRSSIDATVLVGGTLASRKGISLPDTVLPIGPLTEKDKKDLDFALRLGVDWVALSFVQRGEDVKLARELVGQAAWLMSKIEKPAAITDLESIVANSDGLMVARGIWASSFPWSACPACRSRSSAKRAPPASLSWSPRRCWRA
jgi:pyruvate kinase